MKVNANSYCGSGGYGKREVTFGGVRLSLATLMIYSSISSFSSLGYSHFFGRVKRKLAKLFSKERPSIEKEDFQASVLAEY